MSKNSVTSKSPKEQLVISSTALSRAKTLEPVVELCFLQIQTTEDRTTGRQDRRQDDRTEDRRTGQKAGGQRPVNKVNISSYCMSSDFCLSVSFQHTVNWPVSEIEMIFRGDIFKETKCR